MNLDLYSDRAKQAVQSAQSLALARRHQQFAPEHLLNVVEGFDGRDPVEIGEDVAAAEYTELCTAIPALGAAAASLVEVETPETIASAVELVLEGLHLSKRLNKDAVGGRAQYRSRG